MQHKVNDSLLLAESTQKTIREWAEYFSCDRNTISRHLKDLGLKSKRPESHKFTQEQKDLFSIKRKQWLQLNPDKHPWKNKDKFKSEPCERVKDFLLKNKISFVSEFNPEINGRFFSIDIALPDKKIALEINGNQHYQRDGTLKPYYQNRHNLLEQEGWVVYEIHYSSCFNLEKWQSFLSILQTTESKVEFDYFNYTPEISTPKVCIDCSKSISKHSMRCCKCANLLIQKIRLPRPKKSRITNKKACECGEIKCPQAKLCYICSRLNSRKVKERPAKEELANLITLHSFTQLGKMFGVSDNAVRKWCRSYDLI